MDPFFLLREQLTELRSLVLLANPDRTVLQDRFLQLQQQFLAQVLPLAEGNGEAVQSVLTEISRTLRLVAVDMAFLQTSRQPGTTQQRQRQIDERLEQLANWLEYLIQKSGL
ncbi:MAG: heterocyst frequency control protein PatD [Nodosilinea sp.]